MKKLVKIAIMFVIVIVGLAIIEACGNNDTSIDAQETTITEESVTTTDDEYDPYEGFEICFHRSTKKDKLWMIYDPTNQILVSHSKRSKRYTEYNCIGNLEEGLHIINSEGKPTESYYIYRERNHSMYVLDVGADGKYNEFDWWAIDSRPDSAIRDLEEYTTYTEDHAK